jgi:hypothetical protein
MWAMIIEAEPIDLEALQRHYADVAMWLVRDSRFLEPARPIEPARSPGRPRFEIPSRQQVPARP